MRHSRITLVLLVVLAIAGSTLAQDRKQLPRDEQSQYVVSAKAGVVNLVDGEVTINGSSELASLSSGVLVAGLELRQGDVLTSGKAGRAEILLNPGCFLRAGEDTQLVFMFGEKLATEGVKLSRGSVILEASVLDEPMLVVTPSGTFTIIKTGLYRFNVADGRSEVLVRKGRVLSGFTVVKEGKKAILQGGAPVIAALDKKAADSFDDWSKDRAKTLIAANQRLSNKEMKRSLGDAFVGYNVWVYDSLCGCHTFLPYTRGFSSPYGWSYSRCNPFWYLDPWSYYRGSGRSNNNGGSTSGPPANGSGPPPNRGGGPSAGHPPGGRIGGPPLHSAPSRMGPPSQERSSTRETPVARPSGRRP